MKVFSTKIIFFFLLVGTSLMGLMACNQQPQAQSSILDPHNLHGVEIFTHEDSIQAPEFSKEASAFNFGNISEGDIVHHTFHFRNVGHSPLVIKKIVPSCGCTTVSYTSNPVAVSDTGSFTIQFDSKGKFGPQFKNITIFANTIPRVHMVRLQGVVNSKNK